MAEFKAACNQYFDKLKEKKAKTTLRDGSFESLS
jgi:hypothetical protein